MYGLVDMDESAQTKPKYKVGQRVRVVREGYETGGSCHGANVGEEFPITAIESNDTVFAGGWYLSPDEFEPIFSPGNRVRVTSCNGFFAAGDEGVVTYQGEHAVYVKRGEYQRTGFPIDANKLEWLGVGAVLPEHKVEQDNVETLTLKIDVDHASLDKAIADIKAASSGPCIVALVRDGKPYPASSPYVHTSLGSATAEAERLARNNPGQEFAVYQRVAGRRADVEMKEVA